MATFRCALLGAFVLTCALTLESQPALSQPTLASLWPNADGLRWEYEFSIASHFVGNDNFTSPASLQLSGTVETPGGLAQMLIAEHGLGPAVSSTSGLDPLLRAVWRARPDLRAAIQSRYAGTRLTGEPVAPWFPLLLHGGCFLKESTQIQMWQPTSDHPTWTYLEANLQAGATFTQQLVPELADDVYLHGTVEAIDVSVTTQAGTFEHAVRMGYVIDYGWVQDLGPGGNPLYQTRSETRGHVHFVPEVGPVELREDFVPYVETDCGTDPCPPEWTDHIGESAQTQTLSLVRGPVSVDARSWSQIKQLYRNR